MDLLTMTGGIALIHLAAISSPGPTLFVVIRHASAGGASSAVGVVCGVLAATLIWSGSAALGLGTVMAALPWLKEAVRIAGGAYLAWIGLRMLLSAFRRQAGQAENPPAPATSTAAAFRSGFLTNLSNPKVIAYYASLFAVTVPQQGEPLAILLAILAAVTVSALWWSFVAGCLRLSRVRAGFLRARRALDAVFGVLLIGFGVKLLAGR
jgi:threonine efflux protein